MSIAVAAPVAAGAAPLRRDIGPWALTLPLGAAYLAFFAAPLLMLLAVSFYADERMTTLGLRQWERFLGDPFHWKVVADTLLLGAKTVAATVLLGLPLALVWRTAPPFWQRMLLFIVVLPLLTSVVVRTFAWIVILGREGVVNALVLGLGLASEPLRLLQTELGLVIALTQIEMPLLMLPLLAVISRIDPNVIDASASLGASPWRTLFTVILPLSLPGISAGCLLVFASSTTAFISQSVIGGGRLVYLPALVWQQAMVVSDWPFAATAAVMLMVSVMAVIAVIALVGRVAAGRIGG
ncbi:ABC transporter permease [Elioraea tepida]|nr:ABC transporter permease [Elioraea tepida]